MPELDGFGVLEQLRQSPDFKDIPVVVLTAKSLTVSEEQELNRSVSMIIEKTGLTGEGLISEIRKVLEENLEKSGASK